MLSCERVHYDSRLLHIYSRVAFAPRARLLTEYRSAKDYVLLRPYFHLFAGWTKSKASPQYLLIVKPAFVASLRLGSVTKESSLCAVAGSGNDGPYR
jgi:hypothetical protein